MKLPFARLHISGLSGMQCGGHQTAWIVFICLAMALLQASAARSQYASPDAPLYTGQNSRYPGTTSRRTPDSGYPANENDTFINSARLRQFKAERAKALVKDTNQLLKLATELNDEVGGAEAKRLDTAQLRKVSMIAKLARKVEENMKLTFAPMRRAPLQFPNPFPNRPPIRH